MRYFFVVNPNSRNRQTSKLWPEIEDRLKANLFDFESKFTTRPLEAIEIASYAASKDFDVIVSVGGDGTNNEVLNGIMNTKLKGNKNLLLGFIPQGTGGDFRRTVNLSSGIDAAISTLKNAVRKKIDIGKIRFLNHEKEISERYFLNICSFGISGLVDYYVNHTTKLFGGKISFIIGTLRGIFNYQNTPANIIVDEKKLGEMNITLVAVANGRYFGGSMMVAPDARLDDGLFDIIIMKNISKFRFIKDGQKIYRGKHIIPPDVFALKGRQLKVNEEGLYIDLDGEDVGTTPAEISIIPEAIDIIVP